MTTLAVARANCDAVCGLTWDEQYPLSLPLRVELWALVRGAEAADRKRLVEAFRREHLPAASEATP